MSQCMTKPTKWHVRPAKTQISFGIRPVWSESSLCAQWLAKYLSFLHADSEDADQTRRMPRLIWVFAGRTCHFVGFIMHWLKKIKKTTLSCIARTGALAHSQIARTRNSLCTLTVLSRHSIPFVSTCFPQMNSELPD